ncbi:MFS transporter [Pseudomonas resinovorans]|uniref:MFS transporter n=1 Tax=Metapseudomonas resinovorans TaxID=53412 RepID=A0ABT4Y3P5_METRE|nr:MFS transporter [Pseudomonas resinovorans]MDA8483272.1 MFS transporter [Pseudomonas resinovorans]
MSTANSRGSLMILASICLAALVLPMSFTGGAVARPAIGHELGGSAVQLTWITNAFMLTFGSLLMAAGALADQYGRKRLFCIGTALFTVTSFAQGFAPSVLTLDLLRALQGVAGAAALASGSAALAQEFEGHAQTRAFSMLGTTFGIGLAFGPLVSGLLIESLGWRSIFFATAALGALSMIFGLPRMRETRDPNATGLDWPGTLTFTGTLACFTFGVIQGPESGWDSPLVVGLLLASAALLVSFIKVENRVARPMLDLSLFRIPRFVGVQLLPIGTCYCYIVLVVILPLRFIGVEGMSEIEAGWMLLALSAPMLVVPILAATLARWISPGLLSGVGFVIAAVGLQWFSRLDSAASGTEMILPMLLIGVGAGLPWGLMDGLAISVVPKERAGMATGIFNTARVAGEGVALAIVSAILASLTQVYLLGAVDGDIAGLAGVAQQVAAGELVRAATLVPEIPRAILVASYLESFDVLLHILTGITLLSALAVFGFLSRPAPVSEASASLDLSR